jgi:hypothetical protein
VQATSSAGGLPLDRTGGISSAGGLPLTQIVQVAQASALVDFLTLIAQACRFKQRWWTDLDRTGAGLGSTGLLT